MFLINVRETDPDTSHAAAARNPAQREIDRLMVLRAHAAHSADGLTDYELGDLVGRQQNSAGKRRGELRDDGFIEATATRRPGPTGSLCVVWRITPKGLSALASGHCR